MSLFGNNTEDVVTIDEHDKQIKALKERIEDIQRDHRIEVADIKNQKPLTARRKNELNKAVKKTVKQYRTTLDLLAKT